MRQITLTREFLGESITLLALSFDRELHISLYGGHRPHIGAVAVGSRAGHHTTQFPGHREGAICEPWCASLLEKGFSPVVVEAGIHYDDLTPEGIQAVLNLTNDMLAEALEALVS